MCAGGEGGYLRSGCKDLHGALVRKMDVSKYIASSAHTRKQSNIYLHLGRDFMILY